MTCRTSALNWLDVLYNSVRKTPGGVADAARQWPAASVPAWCRSTATW